MQTPRAPIPPSSFSRASSLPAPPQDSYQRCWNSKESGRQVGRERLGQKLPEGKVRADQEEREENRNPAQPKTTNSSGNESNGWESSTVERIRKPHIRLADFWLKVHPVEQPVLKCGGFNPAGGILQRPGRAFSRWRQDGWTHRTVTAATQIWHRMREQREESGCFPARGKWKTRDESDRTATSSWVVSLCVLGRMNCDQKPRIHVRTWRRSGGGAGAGLMISRKKNKINDKKTNV